MLSFGLDERSVARRRDELIKLAQTAESLRKAQGGRHAFDYLLLALEPRASKAYTENFVTDAFDYHLALLYAHLGDPERASACFKRLGMLPHSGGDLLFTEQVRESTELHRCMMEARARGMPSIVMASMPRAASVSLTRSLGETMNAPALRMSVGHFPNYYLIGHWLNLLAPGGAITHDHFGATSFNVNVLEEAGCREVFVLIRDPRAAAASFANLLRRTDLKASREDLEELIVETAIGFYYPWLADWIVAERSAKLLVHWIMTSDIRTDLAGTITRILHTFLPRFPAVEPLLANVKEVKGNLMIGDDDAWRLAVGSGTQDRLWKALPPEAIELLRLKR